MTTSFRLFRAPLSEAGNAVEGVDCSLCGASSVPPPFRTCRLRDPTFSYQQPAFRRKKAPGRV